MGWFSRVLGSSMFGCHDHYRTEMAVLEYLEGKDVCMYPSRNVASLLLLDQLCRLIIIGLLIDGGNECFWV